MKRFQFGEEAVELEGTTNMAQILMLLSREGGGGGRWRRRSADTCGATESPPRPSVGRRWGTKAAPLQPPRAKTRGGEEGRRMLWLDLNLTPSENELKCRNTTSIVGLALGACISFLWCGRG
uniref:Uncharacterized protein n=1 Tax=Ananas comosus var. bracteatus TaxID=296719 RepID=A0A6V7QXQ0_ANACO